LSVTRIVIVGAGQAGAQAAGSLRLAGFDGEIVMFGAEAAPPYQRPPLSKSFLKGDLEEARLYLRPPSYYTENDIDLRTGCGVRAVDCARQTVTTALGEDVVYDKLLLATGASSRKLNIPGAENAGVHYLRTLTDACRLRSVFAAEGRILIVGAGYIGLEVAAALRSAGRRVTVVERAERALARVAGPPISAFFQRLHEKAGVDFRFGASVDRLIGDGGAVAAAELSSGDVLDCDAVLIGVGAAPSTRLAEEAGLAVDDGVLVDDRARASLENVWAAGDCARFPSARYGRRLRLESAPNAIDHAKAAAADMTGAEGCYDPLPWFWSDQYDVKLQTVGLAEGADEYAIRGDAESLSFAVWHLKAGKPVAVEAVNDAESFAVGKRLIALNKPVAASMLTGSSSALRALLK